MPKSKIDHYFVGENPQYGKKLKKKKWDKINKNAIIPPSKGNCAFIGSFPIKNEDEAIEIFKEISKNNSKKNKKKRGRPPKTEGSKIPKDIEAELDDIYNEDIDLF